MILPDIRAFRKTDLSRKVGIRLTEWKAGFHEKVSFEQRRTKERASYACCLGYHMLHVPSNATLNAQAVIDAGRAHLFVSIEAENIAGLISIAAATPVPTHMEDGQIHTSNLSYAFKNYGKTPAIIKDIKHGALVAPNLLRVREYESVVDLPAHILGAGEKTTLIDVIDLPRLTVRDARSIRGAENTFWFYGTVIYDDTFGWRRTLKFVWHYGG